MDGHPSYGGHLALYAGLAEKFRYTKSEIDEMPAYYAYCLLGNAYGPDHIRLRLGEKDRASYEMGKARKRQQEKHDVRE